MTIEHKRNIEEREENPNYQVKAGSTLDEICEEFGISHAGIIINANPEVFEIFSEAERAGDPKLIQFEENTTLKIPKLEIGMVRVARGVDFEGNVQPYVFQLRDPNMIVPVSDAMARRQGMELALSAYLDLQEQHGKTKTKIQNFFIHTLSEQKRHGKTDLLITGVAAGISIALISATGVGAAAVGAMILIAAGVYTFKKLFKYIHTRRGRAKRLLGYYDQDLVYGSGETHHAKDLDNERRKGLVGGDGKVYQEGDSVCFTAERWDAISIASLVAEESEVEKPVEDQESVVIEFNDFDVGRHITLEKAFTISRKIDDQTVVLEGAHFEQDLKNIKFNKNWRPWGRKEGHDGEISKANPKQFKSESGKFKKYEVGQEIVFKRTVGIKKCVDSHNVEIKASEKIFQGLDGIKWEITDTFGHKTKDEFTENRAFAISGDASYSLRRSVLHMRKARQLLGEDIAEDTTGTMTEGLSEHDGETGDSEDQETVLTDIESREKEEPEEPVDTAKAFFAEDQNQVKFEICDDMIKAAKYGMKFIHEVDKFKNYLLPNIVHAVFFIEAHQEYVKHWHELAKEVEKPIINFFKRGNHSQCKKKKKRKMKFWQHKVVDAPGKFCILEATDYQMRQKISQVLVDPQTKIEGGLDIGTLGDGKIHVIKAPESNGLIIDMNALAEQLKKAAEDIQKSIKKNRLWAGNFDKVELEDEEPEPENTRYELFKRDMMHHHNSPSLWRKTQHKWQNYNLRKSKGEKFFDLLGDAGGLALDVFGAPALAGAIEKAVEKKVIDSTQEVFCKIGKGLMSTAYSSIIIPAFKAPKEVGKGEEYVHTSSLLPYSDLRTEKVQDGIKNDPEAKKSGKHYKEGAIHLDRLCKSIARHYINAYKHEKKFREELEKAYLESGQIVLQQDCATHFDFAKELFKFHYEFDKMERHLWALITFLFDLLVQVKELTAEEEKIKENFFDKTVKNWITEKDNHTDCRRSTFHTNYCYGPADPEDDASPPVRRLKGTLLASTIVAIKSVNGWDCASGEEIDRPTLFLRKKIKLRLSMTMEQKVSWMRMRYPTVKFRASLVDGEGKVIKDAEGKEISDYYWRALHKSKEVDIFLVKFHEEDIKSIFEKDKDATVKIKLQLTDPNDCLLKPGKGREQVFELKNEFAPKVCIEKFDRQDGRYYEDEKIKVTLRLKPNLGYRRNERKATAYVELKDGETVVCKSSKVELYRNKRATLEIPKQKYEEFFPDVDPDDTEKEIEPKELTIEVLADDGCSVPSEADLEALNGNGPAKWFKTKPVSIYYGKRQTVYLTSIDNGAKEEANQNKPECFLGKRVVAKLALDPGKRTISSRLKAACKFSIVHVWPFEEPVAEGTHWLEDGGKKYEVVQELGHETKITKLHKDRKITSDIVKTFEEDIKTVFAEIEENQEEDSAIKLLISVVPGSLEGCSPAVGPDAQAPADTLEAGEKRTQKWVLDIKNDYEHKLSVTVAEPDGGAYCLGEEIKLTFNLDPRLGGKGTTTTDSAKALLKIVEPEPETETTESTGTETTESTETDDKWPFEFERRISVHHEKDETVKLKNLEEELQSLFEKAEPGAEKELNLYIVPVDNCGLAKDQPDAETPKKIKVKKEYKNKVFIEKIEPERDKYYFGEQIVVKVKVEPERGRREGKAEVSLIFESGIIEQMSTRLRASAKFQPSLTNPGKGGKGTLRLKAVKNCSLHPAKDTEKEITVDKEAEHKISIESIEPKKGKKGIELKVNLFLDPRLGRTPSKKHGKVKVCIKDDNNQMIGIDPKDEALHRKASVTFSLESQKESEEFKQNKLKVTLEPIYDCSLDSDPEKSTEEVIDSSEFAKFLFT